MKSLIKNLLLLPLTFLSYLATAYCLFLKIFDKGIEHTWLDIQSNKIRHSKQTISHANNRGIVNFSLFTPNQICRYRAKSFSSKEPETLEWLDRSDDGGILFDIGANIGLYSLYYASSNKGKVYAFEPSVLNLQLLAKNIYTNNLQDKINIIGNPLSDKNQFANFLLSNLEEGGALSAFGVTHGYDGKDLNETLSFKTLGFSLDFLLRNGAIPEYPSLIKIDVDGIEHLILAGAVETLRSSTCRSVLIEINNSFKKQADSAREILLDCGFTLKEIRQSEAIKSGNFSNTFNQIWVKKV